MEEAILNFTKQFEYEAEIINKNRLNRSYKHYIVCGMGGSHLATGILKMRKPGIELYTHRDYGLPPYDKKFLKNSLLIASSYSGNTEEVIDFLNKSLEAKFNVAVISTGGQLIEIAENKKLPYIKIPDTGIQPRSAIGFSLKSLCKLMNQTECLTELKNNISSLDVNSLKSEGQSIAESIRGKIPVIYSSTSNLPIAYNWKIKFNETGKYPAFYNLFPELNHNEMQGYQDESFKDKIHFIFLKDLKDHPSIKKRMDITEKILEQKGFSVVSLFLEGEDVFTKIFKSLIIADWATLKTAENRKLDPQEVPMVEDLKKQLK
jgi:glucose/mannose-6-phosphate isomerase